MQPNQSVTWLYHLDGEGLIQQARCCLVPLEYND